MQFLIKLNTECFYENICLILPVINAYSARVTTTKQEIYFNANLH